MSESKIVGYDITTNPREPRAVCVACATPQERQSATPMHWGDDWRREALRVPGEPAGHPLSYRIADCDRCARTLDVNHDILGHIRPGSYADRVIKGSK